MAAVNTTTPLAPSVEKAYYRKCIELKRRLNEVEAANDEKKITRVRLDRSIMKMRLERAFLLEQLSKRMEHNVDGSDGSGDEGMATPPPDRPHRDKRRRGNTQAGSQPSGQADGTAQSNGQASEQPEASKNEVDGGSKADEDGKPADGANGGDHHAPTASTEHANAASPALPVN